MPTSKFLLSKRSFTHLGIILSIWIIVILIVFFSLKVYTHHNETFPTPNFIGLQKDDVKKICNEKQLRFEIIDSVYNNEATPGSIVDQYPQSGVNVKINRKIFLTINALEKEKVPMPDLTGISIREATAQAKIYGLKIGNLKFIQDIAKNNVIYQLYKGEKIKQGTKITKGSIIDLVVGSGLSNKTTFVPCLYGMNKDNAEIKLNNAALNIGAVIYDDNIKTTVDSISAVIWKQYPEFNYGKTQLNLGSPVDIWLTNDSTKITQHCDSLEEQDKLYDMEDDNWEL